MSAIFESTTVISLAVGAAVIACAWLLMDMLSAKKPRAEERLEEFKDPNEVKVVVDKKGFALYFSREPIPSVKKGGKDIPMMRQLCIIPFRRDFLLTFNNLSPTPLEIIESIDMLRLLEHGYKVKIVPTESNTYSVDTPEDLAKVEQLMKNDPLLAKYT